MRRPLGHVLRSWFPWALALPLAALALARVGDLRGNPRTTILILLLAGALHGIACWRLASAWRGWDRDQKRRALFAIFLIALAARLVLLTVPPGLSDDIYRYRWDGRVQAAGLNPYLEPPASESLASLRDALWQRINYPRIRSIYPPLAQWLFRATYKLNDSLRAFQVMAVLGDLLVVGLLLACLARWGLPRWRVALYALSPVVAVEFASSGHFDPWVMAAVLAAIWLHLDDRPVLSTLALAAGILLKSWPVVFVPLLLRRRPLWHVPLLGGAIALAFLPYADAGLRILQPWLDYTGRWLFNDAALAPLRWITGSLAAAKAIAAAAGLALLSWVWRNRVGPLTGGYWLLIGASILLPAIHPWYLLWALPLAAAALDLGWILLCAVVPLAHWILVGAVADSNVWVEPTWVRWVEYLPAALLWLWIAWNRGPPRLPEQPHAPSQGQAIA